MLGREGEPTDDQPMNPIPDKLFHACARELRDGIDQIQAAFAAIRATADDQPELPPVMEMVERQLAALTRLADKMQATVQTEG